MRGAFTVWHGEIEALVQYRSRRQAAAGSTQQQQPAAAAPPLQALVPTYDGFGAQDDGIQGAAHRAGGHRLGVGARQAKGSH